MKEYAVDSDCIFPEAGVLSRRAGLQMGEWAIGRQIVEWEELDF
jgi:hypothetical protein